MRYLILGSFFSTLLLAGCAQLNSSSSAAPKAQTSAQGTLAPKPLFRDPIFDGAADPSIIFNPAEKKWLMFYTNRRANVPGLSNTAWVHGTPIAIAESSDGANWKYRGIVDFPKEIPNTAGLGTYWAPAVIEHKGTYHMYLTIVPGVFDDWNHPRTIVHLTSPDLKQWKYQSTLPLVTDKVIDACVLRLPDGTWRMWYNNERAGKKIYYADSKDLYTWEDKGTANLPKDRGEAPLAFYWKGHYWLMNDLLGNIGLGLYRSPDALTWTRQETDLLNIPGTGKDDQNGGHHPEVIVSGDRAFLYYFVHPGVGAETVYDEKPSLDVKRSSIQVVELKYENGVITADRNAPTFVKLLPPSVKK